jgi:hypothetical protein
MACPILTLPNEILHEILEYVVAPLFPYHYDWLAQHSHFNRISKIRTVCRRFRENANELSFWYKEDFDFVNLISLCKKLDKLRFNPWAGAGDILHSHKEFLKTILADHHLVRVLERRRTWHFDSLVSFQSINDLVPSFFFNTVTVVLKGIYPYVDAKLGVILADNPSNQHGLPRIEVEYRHYRLDLQPKTLSPMTFFFINISHFRLLHSLHLYGPRETFARGPLDLGLLAQFCPLLKNLRLRDMNEYHGNMLGLSRLKDFCILHSPPGNQLTVDAIVPTDSAKSLNRLSIIHDASPLTWPTLFLLLFPNLTSLCLWDATSDICEAVGRSHFRLTEFRIKFLALSAIGMLQVVEMLSARSVRKLRLLRMMVGDDFDVNPTQRPDYAQLVQAISNLHSLEDIWMSMALDLSWCQQLATLVSLKILVWSFPDYNCRNGENLLFATHEYGPPHRKKYLKKELKRDIEVVKKAFSTAFQDRAIAKKPLLYTRVRTEEHQDYIHCSTQFVDPDLRYSGSENQLEWIDWQVVELRGWNYIAK